MREPRIKKRWSIGERPFTGKAAAVWLLLVGLLVQCVFGPGPLPVQAAGSVTISDIQGLVDMKNDLSGNYILNADIDFTQLPNYDTTWSWQSIGNTLQPFSGSFDGQNHTINGLKGNPVFGAASTGATIQNVNMTNVSIESGSFDAVGSLVGSNQGTVANVQASGSVSAMQNVGGIIGVNTFSGVVKNSQSAVTVSAWDAESHAGGLIGINGGTVENSSATGDVSTGNKVGGLIGLNVGRVKNSFASGTVISLGDSTGGLVGENADNSTVEGSYATGLVSGSNQTGGLIGSMTNSTVSTSYATGNALGNDKVGGFIGYSSGSAINTSYATGGILGGNQIGGFIGEMSGSTINNSYATGSVTGMDEVGGFIGYSSDSAINTSYAAGGSSGGNRIGGFIGKMSGSTINNNYATGYVMGTNEVGGLVGSLTNSSSVYTSYAAGYVWGTTNPGGLVGAKSSSTVGSSYYDKETTQQNDNSGKGTPLKTAEMKLERSFNGWEFDTIWQIDERNGYPTLLVLDKTAPIISSASVANTARDKVELKFPEKVKLSNPDGFSVTVAGKEAAITSLSGSGTYTLTLTIDKSVYKGDTVTLGYDQSSGSVRDLADNPLASANPTVTNKVTFSAAQAVAADKAALAIGYAGTDTEKSVTQTVTLPTSGSNGSVITWTSSLPGVIATNGTVHRPEEASGDARVTLVATISMSGVTDHKTFVLTVKALPAADEVAADKAALEIVYHGSDTAVSVKQDVTLPTNGANGTTITWSSDQPAVISSKGVVKRPPYSGNDATVRLTATIRKNTAEDTKTFVLKVLKMSAAEAVNLDFQSLEIGYAAGDNAASVTRDLVLATVGSNESSITWLSNKPTVIDSTGKVTRPEEADGDTDVQLIANIALPGAAENKTFVVTVKAKSDTNAVATDKAALNIGYAAGDSETSVTKDVMLSTAGANGTNIVWSSDTPDVISTSGKVNRPGYAAGDATVTLTATIAKGLASDTKTFVLIVKKQPHVPTYVPVTGVSLSKTRLVMQEGGEAVRLQAVIVPDTATNQQVTWSSSNPAVATVDQDGQVTAGVPGEAVITVTTFEGSFTAACTVSVEAKPVGEVSLSGLAVSPGTLSPAFSPAKTEYSVEVDNDIKQITVAPTTDNETATITVNGKEVGSGEESAPIRLAVGDTLIKVIVVGPEGTSKTYTITVTRRDRVKPWVKLSGLDISEGRLKPAFSPDRTAYTAEVGYEVHRISVTPTVSDKKTATITVNGEAVPSGEASKPLELDVGKNKIEISVTAAEHEDMFGGTRTSMTYTITVNRANKAESKVKLSDLNVSEGRLRPAFDPDRTDYTVDVEYAVKRIKITPTVDGEDVTVTVNGKEVASGEESGAIHLDVGDNTIEVVVKNELNESKTYWITVTREKGKGDSPGRGGAIDPDEERHPPISTGGIGTGSGSNSGANGNIDKRLTISITQNGQRSQQFSHTIEVDASRSADGRAMTTLTLTTEQLASAAEALNPDESVIIPVASLPQNGSLRLNMSGKAIGMLAKKNTTLDIQAQAAYVSLLTTELPMDSIARQWGVEADDLELSVEISHLSSEVHDQAATIVKQAGAELLSEPVQIGITLRVGDNRTTLPYTGVHTRASRLSIPALLQNPEQYAVVLVENGRMHPVPAVYTNGQIVVHSVRSGTYMIVKQTSTFTDISQHWAQSAIEILANKMIMQGSGNQQFNPDGNLTRAQFAILLVRALGLEGSDVQSKQSFIDVDADSWYASGVAVAVEAGIFKGVAEDRFAPDALMTRGQMAIAMQRVGSLLKTTTGEDTFGVLVDKHPATRAEAAVMLKNMLELAGLLK